MGKGRRKKTPSQTPKRLKDSFSLSGSKFFWTFKDCFWEHPCWNDCEGLRFFSEHILEKLKNFEKQTWQEIQSASGGKSEGHGNNSHFIDASKLKKPERKIFIKLGYMEKYEKVFSLRLSGQERLIGFVDLNVFHILWFDLEHNFF